jgi:hypothetical protein
MGLSNDDIVKASVGISQGRQEPARVGSTGPTAVSRSYRLAWQGLDAGCALR